ncbi:MAG TPA: hypothetical protein VFE84_01770 [Patescibacteria group bacterium]|jgi:hypothetical protein|nr:hypothetical protein [Patescibacteria group bacterium]
MTTINRTGRRALKLLAIGILAIPMLGIPLLTMTASPALASDKDVIWLRVEVNDQGGDHQKVKVNVPLSLIEVVVDSIDKREFMSNLEAGHPSLDIPKLWREVRKMEGSDFVTVESEKEHVRVWKDREFFRINVQEEGYSEPNIEVKLPLAIMDYLFESRTRDLNFQDLVDELRGHLPLTLVTVKHEENRIKIWLED